MAMMVGLLAALRLERLGLRQLQHVDKSRYRDPPLEQLELQISAPTILGQKLSVQTTAQIFESRALGSFALDAARRAAGAMISNNHSTCIFQ